MQKLLLLLLLLAQPVLAAECATWPAWTGFMQKFMDGGRIVDPGSARHSTSEGQSYALFFALVANDRKDFESLLKWTEGNLGKLSERLPAWEWGKRKDGSFGILDENSASDSDLWIAYTLAEAGRLWNAPEYSALAAKLAALIIDKETESLPDLGRTLLPGEKSFHPEAGVWRLNPSYVPLQLLRKMATLYPDSNWPALVPSSIDLVVRSSPLGFAPDWITYRSDSGFRPDGSAVGSFNAIRVYLWAGMLSDDDPVKQVLLDRFSPMVNHVATQGTPPLEADTRQGSAAGSGSAGFSAALLPLLFSSHAADAMRVQQLRIAAKAPLDRSDNYYEQALTLFGLGWIEKRYRFSPDGSLIPDWSCRKG